MEGVPGEGAFGTVDAATHPVIGKRAGIEVLRRQYSADPEVVSRFLSKARAVNQIRHRNIIDIFAFGVLDDGRHCHVMELLEGTTLDAYLRTYGRFQPSQALPLLRQLARALGGAHQVGIAHRDLKPENVFLTFDDHGHPIPKLLAFGIAKLLGEGDFRPERVDGASDFGVVSSCATSASSGLPASAAIFLGTPTRQITSPAIVTAPDSFGIDITLGAAIGRSSLAPLEQEQDDAAASGLRLGSASSITPWPWVAPSYGVATGDFDGDGRVDIAALRLEGADLHRQVDADGVGLSGRLSEPVQR